LTRVSIVCGKNKAGKYHYTKDELLQHFPEVTIHDIDVGRQKALLGKAGAPKEPGVYHKDRLKDQQINHFLDFMQSCGIMQDVASGTRSVTLSSGKKIKMPNAVRTLHKAEVVRLYIGACEEEGYTQENGRPSERTIWKMLNRCPASQRKSLAGLDNIAAEGSDSFDMLIQICKDQCHKENALKDIINDLVQGRRYLKGDYKVHTSNLTCDGVADHCRSYALSDPKESCFQQKCDNKHDLVCQDCSSLDIALKNVERLVKNLNIEKSSKNDLLYDIACSIQKINDWKAHILATKHQERQKYDVLENLDKETCFIIVDFAMKFLSRRFRESMSNWFGKSGNGMHVSCVILRDPVTNKLKKRTYITFIGKAAQDAGCVMAIYKSLLQQIKKDFPHIKSLIDKSDNAGCYHNESLFNWKALWPPTINLYFKETMFNERQAGKDQCDRDTATAKRQMNYYIDQGNNIECASDMNQAMCKATALCGFNSCVLEISGKAIKENSKHIKNISRIHSIKYVYADGKCTHFKVWQYYVSTMLLEVESGIKLKENLFHLPNQKRSSLSRANAIPLVQLKRE